MKYMLDTNICIYVMKNKPENVLARFKAAADLILVTNNVREFERVSGLRIENWVS